MWIGNDIVDLGDHEAAPAALHPRFDARVFSDDEQAWMSAEPEPWIARWMLWSAKESALKLARKVMRTQPRFPSGFHVLTSPAGIHGVRCGGLSMPVRVIHDRSCVNALALWWDDRSGRPSFPELGWTQVQTPDSSAAVRELALQRIERLEGARRRFVKLGRVPRLVQADVLSTADVSLSHHGAFVAFAYARGHAGRTEAEWCAARIVRAELDVAQRSHHALRAGSSPDTEDRACLTWNSSDPAP